MTRGRLLGLVVTVALASAAVYGKTAGFEFLPSWDDGESVLQNPDVRELDPRTVWRTFTRMTSVMYQPLTTLSFAVDHAVWGFDPAPFHVENVLLHGVAAVLAFLLVHALSSSALVGAIAAALFLLHPVNVENVAWVSERKTILSACFFFGAVLAYVRARGRGSPRPWTLAALLGSAAMLAKPAAMVLPLALAAYEHWLRPDPRVRLTLPLVPLSAAACVPTLIAHLDRAIHPQSLSVGTLIGTVYPSMTVIFWKYIRLLVWPIDLSAFHDAELYGWVDLPVIAAVLTWVAWRYGRPEAATSAESIAAGPRGLSR